MTTAGPRSAPTSTAFNVTETPPTVNLSANATTINVASTYTLTMGAVTDPYPSRITGFFINWGDGSTNQIPFGSPNGAVEYVSGVLSQGQQFTHTYANAPATVHISVTIDDDGGQWSSAGTLTVQVLDVAPTATLLNPFPSVSAGSSGLVQFVNQYDPSVPDTNAGFHYAYDFTGNGVWNVGNGTYAGSPATAGESVPASYLTTPGLHTIHAEIIDVNNLATVYTTTITVADVAPTINLPASTSIAMDATLNQTGSFTTSVSGVTYTATVDYDSTGVGGAHSPVNLTLNGDNTFNLSHVYSTPGTYTIQVTITDGTVTSSADETVTVVSAPLAVLGVQPTPRGLDIQFNQAINISQIQLYSGTSNATPDLVVTGPNGVAIRGSIVWDATSDTLHFVRTSTYNTTTDLWTRATGPLPAGNYTVQFNGSDWGSSLPAQQVTVAATSGAYLTLPDIARGRARPSTPCPTAPPAMPRLPPSAFRLPSIPTASPPVSRPSIST